jgi:hypothetical protein
MPPMKKRKRPNPLSPKFTVRSVSGADLSSRP